MKVDTSATCFSGMRTGMAKAVFNEIADRLMQLDTEGRESAVDLRSLPLTNADLLELEALLGRGEVIAELDVVGPTSIWETTFAGVWWIRHFGADKKVATEEIAITLIPEILKTHPEDIAAAVDRIRHMTAAPDLTELHKEAENG